MLRRAATALGPSPAALSVRVALALAAAAAAALAPYVAVDAARRIERYAGLTSTEREAEVMRGLRLDPTAFAELRRAMPESAYYEVRVSKTVEDVRGQAFVAWASSELLPRIRVTDPADAQWVVHWGSDRPRGDARLVRRIAASPPLLVLHRP